MCLLFFSYQTTPGHRLVLAANRDEFLNRPTAPLSFFDTEQTILGGKDLQGGGMWLGLTQQGKFGAITNYREMPSQQSQAPSRGEILQNYFGSNNGAADFIRGLDSVSSKYNGFNLILGDSSELYYYSNRASKLQILTPGFYGLSNHFLDTPWPKVVRGKEMLSQYMVTSQTIDSKKILELLEDRWRPEDDQLPETGVPLEWERVLSSIFIDSPGYGTRSSAVITISDNGIIEFSEKTFYRPPSEEPYSELVRFSMND